MPERNEQLIKIIDELENTQQRLFAHLPIRLRPYHQSLPTLPRGCIFLGPRGGGKTTLILKRLQTMRGLFISVDAPWLASLTLWELAKEAFAMGYEGIAFDEVHYAKNWGHHLKALYDAYPQKFIWASDSSSVVLKKDGADLSRRFVSFQIPLLSFREYIYLRDGKLFPQINPFEPIEVSVTESIWKEINIPLYFKEYLSTGIKPFFQEGFYEERSLNSLEKILYSDFPFFMPHIHENHYRALKNILNYLAYSAIPRLNLEKLCRDWQIGKEKLYQLLTIAEQIHLIRIIRYSSQKSSHTKGAKIFLHDPSWYSVLKGNLGNQREAFVVAILQELGHSICVSQKEEECDFILSEKIRIEVGGKNKSSKKADWVIRDDQDLPRKNSLPLWVLGMGY